MNHLILIYSLLFGTLPCLREKPMIKGMDKGIPTQCKMFCIEFVFTNEKKIHKRVERPQLQLARMPDGERVLDALELPVQDRVAVSS